MKIMLIGATGTIGKAVTQALAEHELILVGNASGQYQVDIEDRVTIERLFAQVGKVDAIISTAGKIEFGIITELTLAQFATTINSKIIGHINLLQIGSKFVNQGGSITFTSGFLAQNPSPGSSAVSLANAALDSLAKAAALEFEGQFRVNTVSPRFVKETMEMMGMDSSTGISAVDTAKAYKHAVLSTCNGAAIDVTECI